MQKTAHILFTNEGGKINCYNFKNMESKKCYKYLDRLTILNQKRIFDILVTHIVKLYISSHYILI